MVPSSDLIPRICSDLNLPICEAVHILRKLRLLANGYVGKLLRNGRLAGYLAKNFLGLLFEFQKITEAKPTAAVAPMKRDLAKT